MSFAAEPYAIFAEDLVANLTGGVTRVQFRFLPEDAPFSLGEDERVQSATVRVHGISDGVFTLFVRERDYTVDDAGTLAWREGDPGAPAADATWPDDGSIFWVAYERAPGAGPAPVLTDRNPGSVTRTLAESFAREYAVFSRQLDLVYQAGHLSTSSGRDLEHLAALVGVARRTQTHARGEVVFMRATPASADVNVPAGTQVSTAEPPLVTCEVTAPVTLRRGSQSVNAPVRALVEGPAGVAPARSLVVLHRPILGVEEVVNPIALAFGGAAESDDELRARVARALENAGRATVASVRGALAALEGIREQDVLVEEDHLAHPGVVRVTVAADLDAATALAASLALEDARPAGVRIDHNLPAPTVPEPTVGGEPGGGGNGPMPDGAVVDATWYPVAVDAVVTPSSTQLTQEQRDRLAADVAAAVRAAVEEVGVGAPLIYNRLVAAVMGVEGVLDAVLDVAPADGPVPVSTRVNLRPPTTTRVRLEDADLTVTLRGALVALDVSVTIERKGIAAQQPAASAVEAARVDVARRLTEALVVAPDRVTPENLLGLLPETDDYRVETLGYRAELLEEGLRVVQSDVAIDLGADQQPWIRTVTATEGSV